MTSRGHESGAESTRPVRPTGPLSGITWSHPRGWMPLEAAAAAPGAPSPAVRWDRQDLAGFESHSIARLAERYDLIVLDHPGLGAATAADALLPLDDLVPPGDLTAWMSGFVGAADASYRLHGRQWAVPIDAATQVSALRADLRAVAPESWADALRLMRSAAACLPTKAPHTLLTFLGIAAALQPGLTPARDRLVPPETAASAFDLLREAHAVSAPGTANLDPIQVLDRMADGGLDYCPLLYGYVTYCHAARASAGSGGLPVRFSDSPAAVPGAPPGGILGGTGLAVSRHCERPAAALAQLRYLSAAAIQAGPFARSGGQSAHRDAWTAADVNADAGYFYTRTLRSQITAAMRPRFDGWIGVQHHGSLLLQDALEAGTPARTALARLDALYRKALDSAELLRDMKTVQFMSFW